MGERDFVKFVYPVNNTEMKAYFNHIKYYHQTQYIKLGEVR